MTVQLTSLPHSFRSREYTLAIHRETESVVITMRTLAGIVNTRDLPLTYSLLKKLLPAIFHTRCYNYARWSFAREVRATEVGHLFEHILLTYLCDAQRHRGVFDVVFHGETAWDWNTDALGTFHISLSVQHTDESLFSKSLTQSISLMNLIWEAHRNQLPS